MTVAPSPGGSVGCRGLCRVDSLAARATLWLSIVGLVLCAALAISGLFLRRFYTPEASNAYSDIQQLHTTVAFGLLVRNVHRWSAHALLAVLGGLVLTVLPLAVRSASARWARVSLCGVLLFVALPWLALLAFSDASTRWTGLDRSKLPTGSIRWYGAHPLGVVGAVIAFVGAFMAALIRGRGSRRSSVTFRAN